MYGTLCAPTPKFENPNLQHQVKSTCKDWVKDIKKALRLFFYFVGLPEVPITVLSIYNISNNLRSELKGHLVRYFRPFAQGLHVSLTRKLHIWLSIKDLYISLSEDVYCLV